MNGKWQMADGKGVGMKAVAESLRARSGRELPKYVTDQGDGYRVAVTRGKVRMRGFVAKGRPDALGEALRMREQFLAAAGPMMVPIVHAKTAAPRSNTGIKGISETTKWVRYRPRNCFFVMPGRKRVFWGPRLRTREEALRIAVALRAQWQMADGRWQMGEAGQ